MKKLFLLFSHTLTSAQEADAKASFGIDEFVQLPSALQNIWSNIPSDLEEVSVYLEPLEQYIKEQFSKGDMVLVQGDFGATYYMVKLLKALGYMAVYATTSRNVVEKTVNDKVVKTSVFEHIRFRVYA